MGQLAHHDGHPDIEALLHHHEKEIHFTENLGQFRDGVLFKADFPMGQALATPQGMLIKAYDAASVAARGREGILLEERDQQGLRAKGLTTPLKGHAWMMRFQNASPEMRVEAIKPHEEVSNYFIGDASTHATGVPNFQEVWYRNVYPGVDVRYYPAVDGSLEYDIVCMPGSDPSAISLDLDGIDALRIDDRGSLVLNTSIGELSFPAPVVYQKVRGREKPVEARYVLDGRSVRFDLGNYDTTLPMVIDPIALRWATWVNTNSATDNHGHCIWVDPIDGAIYVVARVTGTTDQITVGAFNENPNGALDMIIGKYLEPTDIGMSGTRVWQTYLGGSGTDNPYAMEQGPDGNLYITGYTSSTNFPLLGGPDFSGSSLDQRAQTTDNIFVTKINTAGTSIKSAVVGGNGDDDSFDLRTTPNGDVVVCGKTNSTNLATLNPGSGASNTNNGSTDVLVFRINQDLNALQWMRNYGGSGQDYAMIMLRNSTTGDLFIAGYTESTNFPTLNPRQATRGGDRAGFLQRLTSTGATTWSSYFQSSSNDDAMILCMEFNAAETEIYFGGTTNGLAASNISAGSYDGSYNGGTNDLFVCRMATDQTFIAGTYLGGSGNEVNMMGLNTDLNNDVYIFAYTNSTNFPTSALPDTPLQTTNAGGDDKVFCKLTSDLATLEFSTYFGGSQDDYDPVGERGIKFSNCRIYTIVTSESNNVPLTQGALNTTKNSSSSIYEPGLVVWANPPDLLGNTISGNQTICAGSEPNDITGSVPSYVLPTIVRNNSPTSYPSLGAGITYQWQTSTDSLIWTDIPGATAQNLDGSLVGALSQKTFIRRIIGGDACILAGAADQVVTVQIIGVSGQVNNVTCNGANNGSITVNSTGTAPFTYQWQSGQTTQTINNLAPGPYFVTVTDVNGCSAQGAFQIAEPPALDIQPSVNDATCDNANGSASVNVSGGTPPYFYAWSTGSTTNSINNVTGGSYSLTVTDALGCQAMIQVNINSTGIPNAEAGATIEINCFTGPEVQLTGSSSTQGVQFSWIASNGGNIVSGGNTATPTV
ncbi:MAG: SBBP repeat-containing protein, partial [Flavobacteriales bacterium]|nr:SBBP repeat-containing protein [Flavobacteriales bacterium]